MAWSNIRKLSSGKTLKGEIEEGLRSLKSVPPMQPGQCDETERRLAEVRNLSRAPTEIAEEVKALDPRQRRLLVHSWTLMARFCRHPDRRTMTKMATLRFEQDARTCSVGSRHASGRFRKVDESTWASTTGPGEVCGALWTARFERDTTVPKIWNYVERISIANPHLATPDLKCSDLKPSEQRYVWGSRDFYAGCDYIKFGF